MNLLPNQSLQRPSTFGSEIDIDDLDKLLDEIRIIGSKLTKIRACSSENNATVAKNNLWTLHWALNMLLKFMNQNNLALLRMHLKGINQYANSVLKEEKENERDYMKTLLEMKDEYRV